MLRLKRHQDRLGSGEPRTTGVDRVAGIGRQRVVAGIEEREIQVEDRLLRPDRRDDLALTVERDVEPALVEIAHRAAEVLAAAVRGVLVRLGLGHGLLHRLDDQRRRRPVGVADAEADHIDPRGPLLGDLALELGEGIWGDALQALTRFHAAPFRSPR